MLTELDIFLLGDEGLGTVRLNTIVKPLDGGDGDLQR
jgi:hypothetical protein